jgi:hypothetical protein
MSPGALRGKQPERVEVMRCAEADSCLMRIQINVQISILLEIFQKFEISACWCGPNTLPDFP